MNKLLRKELKLSASPLSYLFIAFDLMALIPGYPILVGAFFITFGIFQSFQSAREANDILYSTLLPVGKADIVRSKFLFSIFIEMCGFSIMTIMTVLRMTVFVDSVVYRSNVMMNANLIFLGFALLIFGCFNAIFICGFFKTAYYYGKPFIYYNISCVYDYRYRRNVTPYSRLGSCKCLRVRKYPASTDRSDYRGGALYPFNIFCPEKSN